jgi:NitT/TauT family transport system substrate-binding protein
MKSKGLKADTVKYTNIDPATGIGMLAAKKIPAIESFAMSMPGVVKAAGGQDAQIFLLANAGLSLYSNGILVRDDYLKKESAKVKGFVKASLQGWKDTIANPQEAAAIVMKHVKGLDLAGTLQEIVIVNALVAAPAAKENGLGSIDAQEMAASVGLIAGGIGDGGKVAVKDTYDTSALPQPPIKP